MEAQISKSPKNLIEAMVVHEDYEAAHRAHYMYLSKERSDRTGGHLWTEKVVETTDGKLRMLVAEDDVPLSAERLAAEKAPASRNCGKTRRVSKIGTGTKE